MRVLVAADSDATCNALTLRLSAACIPFDIAAIDDARAFLLAYDYDVMLLATQNPAPRLGTLRRSGIGEPVVVVAPGEGEVRTDPSPGVTTTTGSPMPARRRLASRGPGFWVASSMTS